MHLLSMIKLSLIITHSKQDINQFDMQPVEHWYKACIDTSSLPEILPTYQRKISASNAQFGY